MIEEEIIESLKKRFPGYGSMQILTIRNLINEKGEFCSYIVNFAEGVHLQTPEVIGGVVATIIRAAYDERARMGINDITTEDYEARVVNGIGDQLNHIKTIRHGEDNKE